jgi:hypothetical protein
MTVNYTTTSISSLLGLLFIGLKLTGYIDWSWWLVTLPLWGPFALLGGILSIIIIFAVVAATYDFYFGEGLDDEA